MSGPDWWQRSGPLIPERDVDDDRPDWALDHRDEWAGFSSQFAGCARAREEAILGTEKVSGHPCEDWGLIGEDDFDQAMIEGEAWGDEAPR